MKFVERKARLLVESELRTPRRRASAPAHIIRQIEQILMKIWSIYAIPLLLMTIEVPCRSAFASRHGTRISLVSLSRGFRLPLTRLRSPTAVILRRFAACLLTLKVNISGKTTRGIPSKVISIVDGLHIYANLPSAMNSGVKLSTMVRTALPALTMLISDWYSMNRGALARDFITYGQSMVPCPNGM